METKELRLGNWVKYTNNNLVLSELKGKLHQINENDSYLFSYTYVDMVEPIKLTNEILLKCGATRIDHIGGYSFYSFSHSKMNKAYIDIYENRTDFGGFSCKKVEYLHQLQNLFFAVTGNELRVNL